MLPVIAKYVAKAFHRLGAEARAEAIQGAIANTYVAYSRLVERGKESMAYPTVLARFAVSHVWAGRQVGGRQNVRDVSAVAAQRRKRFLVERLDRFDAKEGCWRDVVVEDRQTPVLDRVAFLLDYPAWLNSLPQRERKIAELLADGYRVTDVARCFALSLARISQLRREFHKSWLRFHGEAEEQDQMNLRAAA